MQAEVVGRNAALKWMKERIGRGYAATIPLSMVGPINYST